jgi:hypothetical protein
MTASNPVESLAQSVYTALSNPHYLGDIEYLYQSPQDRRDGKEGELKLRRPRIDEVKTYHFPQMWGSTALGFGGIGGAAMTEAYTTVVTMYNQVAVFFDGRHAYSISEPNQSFVDDLKICRMASVRDSEKYKLNSERTMQ